MMRRRRREIQDFKEHGLGHLLNPHDPEAREKRGERHWIGELWAHLIGRATGETVLPPSWLDRPALSRLGITDPSLHRPFAGVNKGKPYRDQVKPFNFLLAAHVLALGYPADANPTRFQLIAPFHSDPRQWSKLAWINRYDGKRYGISFSGSGGGHHIARVATYADQLRAYEVHPEAKSGAPDGEPCGPGTIGLLQRRHVHAVAPPAYIGKESNELEEVEAGIEHDWHDVRSVYKDTRANPWRDSVVPILKAIPLRQLAEEVQLSERAIKSLRNGHSSPSPETRAKLTRAAADYARSRLPLPAPDDEAACAAYCAQLRSNRSVKSTKLT